MDTRMILVITLAVFKRPVLFSLPGEFNIFFLKPIPDPLPRPDASEYDEFKDYEHVGTVGDDQDSEKVIVDNKDTCTDVT